MHPTGFPLFTMLAGAFAHLFPVGEVSWRIALFSALATSGAAWLVYRVTRDLCGNASAALGAAWLFAFGPVIWTRGTRPEVHDLAIFFMLIALRSAIRWCRCGERWALPVCALAFGLAFASHSVAICVAPALGLLVLRRARAIRAGDVVLSGGALLVAACLYAYLPIRSAIVDGLQLDPMVALGKPPGNAFWNTDDPSNWSGFARLVTGADFPTGDALRGIFDPGVYAANGPAALRALFVCFTPVGLALALLGIADLWRRERIVAIALALFGFLPSAFAFGYTVVADIDRYFFSLIAGTAILAGIGGAWASRLRIRGAPLLGAIGALVACAVLIANRDTFSQRLDPGARDLLNATARLTPPHAILIAPWQQATALAYGAYVSGVLAPRVVESSWYGDDAKYIPEWVRRRPVYVVGSPWGSVKGYALRRISKDPEIYRVVKRR